jgi:hypothetical protein
MDIDYTRSEVDVLIDLIRNDNGNKPLSSAQVTFGTPTTFNPLPTVNRNTVIMATAIPGLGFRDSTSFYYNRVRLIDFIPPNAPSILTFDKGEYTVLSDLLPELNERLNTNITADKIIEQTLPALSGDDEDFVSVDLVMRPNSVVYLGQLTLKVTRSLVDLATLITIPNLSGLTYSPPA